MEQKILKIKEGRKRYTFHYFRYKLAEWLHKAVNYITWTYNTVMGHAYRFSKEDLESLREEAQREGVPYEEKEKELIERWHKQMIDNLLRQLEFDGYLRKTVEKNGEGGIDVGFRFKMLCISAKQIFNEDNAVTF